MSSTPKETPSTTSILEKHHHGRRLKQFIRPNGQKVHVAASPEDADHVRRKMSEVQTQSTEDFDLYIHGSPEHLDTIREVHAHHEQLREDLRQKHGDVYDEFENVRVELDALSQELHLLSDHGVSLDANFSKYGYSAHLRGWIKASSGGKTGTRGGDDSPDASIHTGPSSTPDSHDWDAERKRGVRMKFWKRPIVRQYFHKGLLWRASETEEVASFELFVDLLYVGIIAINGDNAVEFADGKSLLRFCITFILSWKLWSDLTMIISWFETDDMFQRLCVMFVMACLFGYTTNITESDNQTYAQLIAFYVSYLLLFSGAYYLWICYLIPMVRGVLIINTLLLLFTGGLWIASIHVDEPNRQALIWLAIFIDLFGQAGGFMLVRFSHHVHKGLATWLESLYEFYPAINIEHKTERTNAFVTLVFGYSVVAMLYQNSAPLGINAFYGKAVLGLIQAFAFNWIYFEIDAWNLHVHAIRRHMISSFVWMSIHLPFIMGYVLAAAALAHLVIAHDCSNTDTHSLSEAYAGRSEGEISMGLRWFYCAGLGIALACIISMSHVHKSVPGQRLKKSHRLAIRFAVAIILICLPLTDSLNSLQLISTTTGLTFFVLIVELMGSSCVHDAFVWDKKPCKYTAQCRIGKKDVEHAIKTGEVVDVRELAKREKDEYGAFELS
ncbi:MAG: hypothetical protein M1812_005290 [Candelaria pacifica]|nr:MAG: hypothetical protein M1812_005290 [Candelaria pacifica]